jgi:diguanylate cyclase (GGDEF)-like protein
MPRAQVWLAMPPSGPRRRLTPVFPWPAIDTLDAHVRAEQVRVVFRQAPPAQLISLIAVAVIGWALWGVADHGRLVAWFFVVSAATLGRLSLTLRFQRREPPAERLPVWEQTFLVSLAGICLAWGVGGWWIMPRDSPLHQAIVYFFLMGVAGGAVATYAVHTAATVLAVCLLMLPATIGLALQPVLELRVLAAGGLLYVAAALRSTRSFGYFLHRTFQLSFELHQAYGRAHELARTDELTGLANRRAFVEQGTAAIDQARRYHRPLSLVMLDIDHFKRINDQFGHAVGDAALQHVAAALRRTARAADTSGRLGGEEFALLLPETGVEAAAVLAERLRRDVAAAAVPANGATLRLTCSFGVAQFGGAAATLDALLGAADAALYRAKEEGRDRVVRSAG